MLLVMEMILIKFSLMKNLYKIGMLAVAALAFASCNKEVDTPVAKGTHVVTVKATKDFDTKTAIVEEANQASYIWTDGDEDYFHVYENGIEAKKVTMSVDDDGLATFTVEFDDTDATSFEYTAKYFNKESNSHNPLIPADQKPTLTSFDPSADVLIAQSQTKEAPATELQFALRRVVSINKMTLKGLVEGEKISSVELASSDKNFSAYFVAASTEIDDDGNEIEKPENYSAAGKKLSFDYSELEGAVVGSDGTFAVYFVSAPVEDATFSVKVTTDQNVYERDLSSKLTLVVGQVKRFGIQLGDYGTPISAGTVYTLVESNDDLSDGATYIIVASKEVDGVAKYYALGAQASNNRSGAAIPAPSNKIITIDNTSVPYPVKLTAAGLNWYIIDNLSTSANFGQYIYNASNTKSYLRSEATPDSDKKAEWTIAIANGIATINNVGNTDRGCLVMNFNNGSPLFNVYGSLGSYSPLALYVDLTTVSSKETPTIAFSNPTTTINVGETITTNVATIDPSTLSISYSASPAEGVVTVEAATGKVTGVAAGKATITASFAGNDEYKAVSAFYEITVVDPNANDGSAEKPYTASEAIAVAKTLGTDSQEGVYVKGIVSTAGTINSQYNSVTYYISNDGSATDQFEVYSGKYIDGADFTEENNLKLGDYVVVCGTLKYYRNQAEFDYNSEVVSILRAPSFDPDGGTFTTDNLSVVITAESGATIRYTTDGTDPTSTTGSVYSTALTLSETTTVKAISVKNGLVSGVVSKVFTKSNTSAITETLIVGSNGNTTWTNGEKTASATVGDVTFTALGSGGNDGKYYSSDNSWRFYTANSSGIKITVPSGKKITSVVIKWKTGIPVTPSGFTASGSASPTTYTANSSTSVNEVSFVRGSANFLAQEIAVTYE